LGCQREDHLLEVILRLPVESENLPIATMLHRDQFAVTPSRLNDHIRQVRGRLIFVACHLNSNAELQARSTKHPQEFTLRV